MKTTIILAIALATGSVPAVAKQIDLPSAPQVSKSSDMHLAQRWNSRNVSMPRGRGNPQGGDRAPVTGGGY